MEWPTAISTLIAIGAFIMSGISLYISIRKDTFEREVATAEQSAILLSKIGEQRVQLLKYDGLLSRLHKRYSDNGDTRLHSIELFQKAIDLMSPVVEKTFEDVQGNNAMTYREIKMRQGRFDVMNSTLAYVIQGTNDLLKDEPCDKSCEQAVAGYVAQGAPSPEP